MSYCMHQRVLIRKKLTQERSTEAQTEEKCHLDDKADLVSGLEGNVLLPEMTQSKCNDDYRVSRIYV